jgi:S-formylglutathione hydrolase FrmB
MCLPLHQRCQSASISLSLRITKRSFMRYLALALFICTGLFTNAATVDTVTTFSPSMKKNIKAVVIKPDSYAKATQLPVVYLLHGHGGNYADWIKKVPAVARYADQFNILVVCPDGNVNSWYWDSPVDSTSRYETYVSTELVSWIDEHYKTIKNRSGRGITGLSMGGHGALYLAFRHQDVFGAVGSMSGGVDIRPFPLNWGMAKYLGNYATHRDNWERNTVINNTHLLTKNSLAIMIDCGVDDFFYTVNNKLHEQLLYNNIPHDYLVRPGAHDWNYWANAVHFQLLFMSHFFNKE